MPDGGPAADPAPPREVIVWAFPRMVVPIMDMDLIVDAGLRDNAKCARQREINARTGG